MGFSSPKQPKPDRALEALERQQMQAAIDQAKMKTPSIKPYQPQRTPPPAQQTAADQAAAERMARQNMAGKKGIQWTQNPSGLGGAGGL
jgi:hypothetical protein